MLQTKHRPTPKSDDVPDDCVTAILAHIGRYRLSVFNAIERLPVFSDAGASHVKGVLSECRRQSLLGSAPLHRGAKYWYLDGGAAERCNVPEHRTGPLSEPAKLRALAMLRFCCLSDRPRHRITAEELTKSFPDLDRPGLPDGYYFDPQGAGRLGLVRVDAGRRGRWDRVIQSLREDIDDHVHQAGFRRLIQAGRFEITVLTVFRQKALRIRDALAQYRDARRAPLQIVAMPELLPLLSSRY